MLRRLQSSKILSGCIPCTGLGQPAEVFNGWLPTEPIEPEAVGVSAPKSIRLGALGVRCGGGGGAKALSPNPSSCAAQVLQ